MVRPIIINKNVIDMEYAVRGPIPQRAAKLKQQGRKIIPCNIGNPQALGQKPITYYRSVTSLLEDPGKINRERTLKSADIQGIELISDYALETSEYFLSKMGTGMGAYTDSKGPLFIRESIADFIDERDGFADKNTDLQSNPEYIFLTDGASEGARAVLELLIADENDGIMIPTPQYPLYSATIRRCGGKQVNYYPDEDRGWLIERSTLEDAYDKAKKTGIKVKAIVVINPANPTGAILDLKSISEIIDFAIDHELSIIADEVYQDNLYGKEFTSFARAVGNMDIPLFSLHSVSKGFYGECGHRGGYLEVRNPPQILESDGYFVDILFKLASVNLCSNTIGQALVYLMVNPPEKGSDAYHNYQEEKKSILDDLYERATIIRNSFKEMDGMECFGEIGALYLFPRMNVLPAGTDDFDYCMALLEKTGLCVVNGAGFGQKPGTSHLRIAFLPPRSMLEDVLPAWINFHNQYVNQ
jgi:aspartate/methionine/tyrosine aminotransferase